MTKDELIDQLAAQHRTRRWQIQVEPWDELEEEIKDIWRSEILQLWPMIHEFVAAYIERQPFTWGEAIAKRWRGEMT